MQISAINSLYTSFIKNTRAQNSSSAAKTTTSNDAYQLDLSPQARAMLNKTSDTSVTKQMRTSILDLPENKQLKEDIKHLEQKLNSFLMSQNIENLNNYQFEYLANNTVRLNNNPYNKREIETVINNNRELVNDIRNVLSESQIAAANDLQNQYVETRQRSDIKGNVEKSETLLQRTISSQGILANVGGYFSLTEGKLNINTVSAAQNIILMY